MKNEIKKKVTKYNLTDCVFFLGVRDDIPSLLQAMDVFLMPSYFEGLPVTLVEAQASGIKCVVSDVITEEVNCTNLINWISLNKTPEYWAEHIIENSLHYVRRDTSKDLRYAGYDIIESARWMQEFYLKS